MYLNFSSVILSALAATAVIAAPGATTNRDVSTASDPVTDAIIFAAQGDCNSLDCVSVMAGMACMAVGMANEDAGSVLGCVTGGAQAMCACMNCWDALESFLTSHNLCPS